MTYVRSRVEDRSFWIKSAYMIEKYKVVWLALILLAGYLGFQTLTPVQRITNLEFRQARMDTTMQQVLQGVQLLNRLQCLDRDDHERALIGLECKNVPYTRTVPK